MRGRRARPRGGQHLRAAGQGAARAGLDRARRARCRCATSARRRCDYELPVYEEGTAHRLPDARGSQAQGARPGGIRELVCRHLISAGYWPDEEPDGAASCGPATCAVPPAAVFRSLADPGVAAGRRGHLRRGAGGRRAGPCPPSSPRGRRGAAPPPRDAPPSAPDVIGLLRFLRGECGRGRDVDPRRCTPPRCGRRLGPAEARTRGHRPRLVAHLGRRPRCSSCRCAAPGRARSSARSRTAASPCSWPPTRTRSADGGRPLPRRPRLPARSAECVRRWCTQAPPERLEPDSIRTGAPPTSARAEPELPVTRTTHEDPEVETT